MAAASSGVHSLARRQAPYLPKSTLWTLPALAEEPPGPGQDRPRRDGLDEIPDQEGHHAAGDRLREGEAGGRHEAEDPEDVDHGRASEKRHHGRPEATVMTALGGPTHQCGGEHESHDVSPRGAPHDLPAPPGVGEDRGARDPRGGVAYLPGGAETPPERGVREQHGNR